MLKTRRKKYYNYFGLSDLMPSNIEINIFIKQIDNKFLVDLSLSEIFR